MSRYKWRGNDIETFKDKYLTRKVRKIFIFLYPKQDLNLSYASHYGVENCKQV